MRLENGQSIGVETEGDPCTMAAAIVLHVATPDDPDPQTAGALLREAGVTRIAWIAYHTAGGHEVVFAALERADGWRDFRGTKLHIWTISRSSTPAPKKIQMLNFFRKEKTASLIRRT